MKRNLWILLPLALLVGCDHTTKDWASSELAQGRVVELVPGILDLSYVQNHDVAFNALRWVPEGVLLPALLLLGTAFAIALTVWSLRGEHTLWQRVGFALVAAGAIGNVIDRWANGFVTDFIHLHHWPVFNVADICVSTGVALLLWLQWREGRRAPPGTAPA